MDYKSINLAIFLSTYDIAQSLSQSPINIDKQQSLIFLMSSLISVLAFPICNVRNIYIEVVFLLSHPLVSNEQYVSNMCGRYIRRSHIVCSQ